MLGIRIATEQKSVGRMTSVADDVLVNNTLIYDTKFTNALSDDTIIMVLEDFTSTLTLDMFEMI